VQFSGGGSSVKTVKVRIAVAVDEDGDWNAAGNSLISDCPDRDAVEGATGGLFGTVKVYWIDLELPVPEAATVQASVTPEKAAAP
jgi:hypothetical protein